MNALLLACAIPLAPAEKPNILLIMADDLGYECLGCYGGQSYKTPNLDALAASGMRFTNCFSTPKCSPSRVTIMTGRYTFRTTTKWGHLPDNEITFGRVLQDAGYATALGGKWQMALLKKEPGHVQRFGFQESAVWAWHEGPRYWRPLIYRNDTIMKGVEDRFGPDVTCDFLIEFMRKNKDRPFLAYYPMALTHWPKKDEPPPAGRKHLKFSEMVSEMDREVGRLVKALDDLGLREKTLILFTGDNGTPTNVTSVLNGRKIKGGKARLTDAGTRVPLLASWPGTVPDGSTNGDLIDFTDFMPTLAEISGTNPPQDRPIDGRSFAPRLRGKPGNPRDWIYTWWSGKSWVRDQDWKLYKDGRLFDMKNDPVERSPLPRGKASSHRVRLEVVFDRLMGAKSR